MKYYGTLYGCLGRRSFFDTGRTGEDWEKLEQERDRYRDALKIIADSHDAPENDATARDALANDTGNGSDSKNP